nr:PREDICTED: uncharacterized protein LOC103367799 [Stegastes partitus]
MIKIEVSEIMKITKRETVSDDNDTQEIPAEQKACVQDTYGCINWEPTFLPLSEAAESQQKKEEMKKMFKEMNYNTGDMKNLMQTTYYMQRKDINKEAGMATHTQELTNVGLMESFLTNVDKKGLLHFLKNADAQKCKKVLDTLIKFQTERGELDGGSQDITQMVLLLLAHFGEQEDSLFHTVEETCLAREVQMEKLPATPCFIECASLQGSSSSVIRHACFFLSRAPTTETHSHEQSHETAHGSRTSTGDLSRAPSPEHRISNHHLRTPSTEPSSRNPPLAPRHRRPPPRTPTTTGTSPLDSFTWFSPQSPPL